MAVVGAAGVAVLLWGATPMVTKIAVGGIDPLAIGILRTVLGALVALPVFVAGGLRLPRGARTWRTLMASAMGGFVLFPLLFTLGMGRTSAGHGALMLGILPVFTGLVAAAVERRRPGPRWWLGCAVAAVGTALLAGARFGADLDQADALGDGLVLAGALAASVGYVAGARAAREIGTWQVTLWGLIMGGLVLVPIVPLVVAPAALIEAGAATLAAVAYLAVGSSIVAYAAWYWALGHGGIGRTGLAQFAQPLVGLVMAVAVLGEAVTLPMGLAAAAILGGVALARGSA